MDYESTHRRTLFNVSLTFLFSISSPPTLSRWRRMGREEKPGERERERRKSTDEGLGGDAMLCLYFTQGHEPQTESRVRVHGRASQSGGGQVWEASGFCSAPVHLAPPSRCSCVFLIDHLFVFLISPSLILSMHTALSSLFCSALVKEL